MRHLIGKQIIELRLNNRQDAFRIQQLMSDHYRNDLLPLMRSLFDEAAAESETLYIDTLEIDLGVLTEKEFVRPTWDDELLAPLINQLRSTLAKYSARAEKPAGVHPASLGICRQWLFYMQRGYLSWNTLQVDSGWKQKVLEALSSDFDSVTALRELIRSDSDAITRIVEQHLESFLIKLIETLTARKQHLTELLDELEILYRVLPESMGQIPAGNKIEIRKKFLKIILEVSAASETTGEDQQTFVQQILEKSFNRLIRSQDLPKNAPSKLPRLWPIIRVMEEKAMTFNADVSSEIIEEIDVHQNGHARQEEKPEVEEEAIFVRQAGAVLLHPFLSTFFSRLKLTEAGAFRSLAAQQKAMYLLHHLCTGVAEAEEHELVVPKVLCGYPLKKPVRKGVHLTKKEKEESARLLEEFIRQWEKLKNTSTAGLREGFLQRAGKLVTKNDLWSIQVETETIDVLLDHLPWNLSIIKLPWMKDMVRVEWR